MDEGKTKTPTVLIILDGYGLSDNPRGNAVTKATKPNIDAIFSNCLYTQLEASGTSVGLPPEKDGNSEVGHLNLGAGRIVYQELPRINLDIADGKFKKNKALLDAVEFVKNNNSRLHFLGLIGEGVVHSSNSHLYALISLAADHGIDKNNVLIHLITDGRDSRPRSAEGSIKQVLKACDEMKTGQVVSILGRYYAMDRNNNWNRTELAYQCLSSSTTKTAFDYQEVLSQTYKENLSDEFILPTALNGDIPVGQSRINNNDALIIFNFRADRVRQITKALVLDDFNFFIRKDHPKIFCSTLTDYEEHLPVNGVAYPSEKISYVLSEILSKNGCKQLHIAETEKYAHVTYFFNGRREEPFANEDRVLIPSPQVATYDETPKMSAQKITDYVLRCLSQQLYDFYLINFANPDMVAHTGSMTATLEAIETVDGCLGQIFNEIKKQGGRLLLTADHGNAEELQEHNIFNPHDTDTKHSTNPVPLAIYDPQINKNQYRLVPGILGDVAPTILYLMDISQPMEMTGMVLIEK